MSPLIPQVIALALAIPACHRFCFVIFIFEFHQDRFSSFESFASESSSAVEGLTVCVPFASYEMMVARGVSEPAYISLPPGLSLIEQQDSSILLQDLGLSEG